MIERGQPRAGFSLFELLVVLAIVSAAIAVVLPSVSAGFGALSAKSAALEISSAIALAREKALRERSVYYAETAERALIIRPADGKITEYSLPAGLRVEPAPSISFSPGGFSSGGEIIISSSAGSYVVRVLPTGRTMTERLDEGN